MQKVNTSPHDKDVSHLKASSVSVSYLLVCLVALYVVKVRAEAMQKASELVPSGMLSVVGRPQAQYKYACVQAKDFCKSQGIEEPVCAVANYLFPDGRVIAGHQKVQSINPKHPQFIQIIVV